MEYAILTKAGGELIAANKADYQDYYGFLKCPECHEPVFLRQGHLRQEKRIKASFVHHKAVPEISTCELRIGKYSKEDIETFASKARNQRLQKLNISMWKYVKTNMAVNFKVYNIVQSKAKNYQFFENLLDYGHSTLIYNTEYIVYKMIPMIGEMMENKDDDIEVISESTDRFNKFMSELKSDWLLHEKIAQEAAELFLSPQMKEVRTRVLMILCYPNSMKLINNDLVELTMESEVWQQAFVAHLTNAIALIFISVNWIQLLD